MNKVEMALFTLGIWCKAAEHYSGSKWLKFKTMGLIHHDRHLNRE